MPESSHAIADTDAALAAVRERVDAHAASVAASAVAEATVNLESRREPADGSSSASGDVVSVREQEVLAVLAARIVAGSLPDADATTERMDAGARERKDTGPNERKDAERKPGQVAATLDALFPSN